MVCDHEERGVSFWHFDCMEMAHVLSGIVLSHILDRATRLCFVCKELEELGCAFSPLVEHLKLFKNKIHTRQTRDSDFLTTLCELSANSLMYYGLK